MPAPRLRALPPGVYTPPMAEQERVSAAILAGGASRRMGRNKALLPIRGQTLIERVIDRVRPLADEVWVVTNTPEEYAFLNVLTVSDRYPGVGPLAGLHAALDAARGDLVILLACDMPFVSVALLRYLLSLTAGVDAVIPRLGGREEPLHAIYRRVTCLPAVEAALHAGKRRLIAFLPAVRVRYVEEDELRRRDPELRSFLNANTPQEWAHVLAMAGREEAEQPEDRLTSRPTQGDA